MSGFPLGFSSPGGRPGACLPGDHVPGEMSRRWEGGEGSRGSAWGSREPTGKEAAPPSQVAQGFPGGFLHLSQFACLCVVAADLA